MNRRTTPVLILPLAALLAVAFPSAFNFRQTAPTPQEEPAKVRRTKAIPKETKSPDKEKAHLIEKHDVNRILSKFFGVTNFRTATWRPVDFRKGYSIDFVIATVPDPLESRLPYLFDRFLGSIQRAAEADKLVLDRFDLPWIEGLEKKETAKGAGEDPREGATGAEEVHDYRSEPGLVLFRDPANANGPRLYVVFVVGETPTAGVHKDAFLSALHQIDELSGKQTDSTIKILGPSFSGSAESMDFVLCNWLKESGHGNGSGSGPWVQIHIVSGSATAIPINGPSGNGPRYYFDLDQAGAAVTFESTVAPDEKALKEFFDFLADQAKYRGSQSIRVGLLTEANTAYGNAVATAAPRLHEPKPLSQRGKHGPSAVAETAITDEQENDPRTAPPPRETPKQKSHTNNDPGVCVTPLPFPLHISRLRSELEKNRAQQNRNSPQTNQNQESKYLPVPYEDESAETVDSIPPFSDLETSSSELILSNLLSTLSQEHFDYVGIVATDVRDTIFLAREVREHSPSSILFSLNADLIYTHPEANPNTRGMLAITPYPLFTLNQRWMDPRSRRTRLQFPDQNSEGVYNAMLLLLGREDQLMEYGIPFRPYSSRGQQGSADSQPDQLPEQFRKPHVWVTTVGRGGFWPITVLEDQDSTSYTHTRSLPQTAQTFDKGTLETAAEQLQGTLPHSAILVFALWSLLCGIPAFSFVAAEFSGTVSARSGSKRSGRFSAFSIFHDSTFVQNRSECRAYYLVGGIATLSAFLVALAALGITSLEFSGWRLQWSLLLGMIAVAGLTFWACLLLARDTVGMIRGPKYPGMSGAWLAGPVLLIGAAGLGFAGCLSGEWVLLRYSPDAGPRGVINGIVTGYRALNLASGVSPLVPLFLIALAASVWAACAVRRVRLAEAFPWIHESDCGRQKDTPGERDSHALFNSKSNSFTGFQELESRVQRLLRCPSLHLPGELRAISLVVSAVVVAAGIYLFYCRLVVAFEAPIFYLLFGLCFMLVYLSIVFNTLRLLFLWLGLSKVLQAMGRHRIRRAFSRFYRNYPHLPRINLASAPPPLTALSFSVEHAGTLLRSARTLPAGCNPLVNAVAGVADEIVQAAALYRQAVDADTRKDRCDSLYAQLKSQRCLARVSWAIEGALNYLWRINLVTIPADEAVEKKGQKLTDQAEEFLVGRTVLFLSHIFPQMTNLAGLSLASLLLLLLAVSSYPFQPHQLLVLFSWIIIFAFVGVALYMSVQMNRDTLLSNLNGSKPGELNWDREFITRILLYVVIPILGFLGVQFPDAVTQIFSFLSPAAPGHG